MTITTPPPFAPNLSGMLSPLMPPPEWECWVAYDYCNSEAYGIFPNELDALRFAMENREYMLKVKRIEPGDVREQLK